MLNEHTPKYGNVIIEFDLFILYLRQRRCNMFDNAAGNVRRIEKSKNVSTRIVLPI